MQYNSYGCQLLLLPLERNTKSNYQILLGESMIMLLVKDLTFNIVATYQ